ncbi:MAG: NAD(P)/FAD-dependent oxidoreductase [Nocardioidaceae bacterium]
MTKTTDSPSQTPPANRPEVRHRVVVVGGGFGGLQAVRHLRDAPVDVTLIDRRNFHLFQPLLYQVATGALSPDEIATPLRAIVKRQRNVRVVLGEVRGFDLDRRSVLMDVLPNGDQGVTIDYDTLIVAGGSRYSYFGHDEWQDFAFEIKTLESALAVRRRIFTAFEAAKIETDPQRREAWLTFVVVGGGPTGVEMAGQIAELARDTLAKDFRSIDSRQARILLVEAAGRILPTFPERLSTKAAHTLEQLGVTLVLDTAVVDLDEQSASTRRPDGSIERVPTQTMVWATGVVASELAGALATANAAETGHGGRLVVGEDLTVPGRPEVIALGDIVSVYDAAGKQVALPGLASVAMQQGRYAAGCVRARLRGTVAALSPHRHGQPRHGRPGTRHRGHQGDPVQRHAGLADLGAGAHPLPHRLSEPPARRHPLGLQLRDPWTRGARLITGPADPAAEADVLSAVSDLKDAA